jgi:NADH:ubiquinone oxidoreductase subunit 5 (subunit L)/multisubunit Na+/H+ antiporter MnhA subunit
MPNLGIYLLYRVTPLLALAGPLRNTMLWIASGGAVLAGLAALRHRELRVTLIYQEAAQTGLLVFVAAAGVKEAIWLSLFVLTPLRLLLFLAADVKRHATSNRQQKIGTSLLTLGGIMLVAFNLLIVWWAGRTGVRADALFLAQAAVALTAVLSALMVRQSKESREETSHHHPHHVRWPQGVTLGVLGLGIVGGGLVFGPLTRHLMAIASIAPPTMPTLPALLRYTVTSPAILLVAGVTVIARTLWQWTIQSPIPAAESTEEIYDLEEGLIRAARALHAVVEVGMLEGLVALFALGTVEGARFAYRVVEQEGLEGLLNRAVQGVMALARRLRRWHTGRLRYNLLWAVNGLELTELNFDSYGI